MNSEPMDTGQNNVPSSKWCLGWPLTCDPSTLLTSSAHGKERSSPITHQILCVDGPWCRASVSVCVPEPTEGRLPSGDAVVSSLGSRGESSTDLSEHLCGGLETMSAMRRCGRESYDVASWKAISAADTILRKEDLLRQGAADLHAGMTMKSYYD